MALGQPTHPRVPWRHAVRVPLLPAVAGRKRAAITRFSSQLQPRPGGTGPVLPGVFVPHFLRGYEVLIPVERP